MSSEENVNAGHTPQIDEDEDDEMTIRELPTLPSEQKAPAPDNFHRDAATVIAAIDGGPPRAPLTMESSGLYEVDDQQIVGDGATTVQDLSALEAQLQHRHAVFSSKTAQISIDESDEPTQGPTATEPQVDAAPIGAPVAVVATPVEVVATPAVVAVAPVAAVATPAVVAVAPVAVVATPAEAGSAFSPLPVSGLHEEEASPFPARAPEGRTHHPVLEDTAERSLEATLEVGGESSAAPAASSIPEPLPEVPAAAQKAPSPIEVTPTHLNARAIEEDHEGVQIRRWQVTPVRVAPASPPKPVGPEQSPVHTRLTTILFDAEASAEGPVEAPKASWGASPASEESADSALAGHYVGAALEDIDALLPLGLELSPEARRLFQGGLQGLAQKLRRARALLPEVDEP